jgi:hypothetical protein
MRLTKEKIIFGMLLLIIAILVFLIIKKLTVPAADYFVYPIP